jgi:hypothetical protein
MNDDYLWDGSGEPDPEIQKLETTLGRFRHQGQVPEFPEITATAQPPFWRRLMSSRWSFGLAAATATILFIAAFGILHWSQKPNTTPLPGWDVESLAGTPRVESNALGNTSGTTRLGVGQTLVTDSRSMANISVADIGTVNVEPNTRLRLVAGGSGHNRLALDRGTIHAYIWALPGEFTVDTPSAIAVDLGCAYTLQVDDSGAGLLRTTLGWVGFKLEGHEAFIPAGAVCATRPKVGPGTPYFGDASSSFREALSKFDFAADTREERGADLTEILAASRQRDALTIWHLLARVGESDRGRVYDRLARLVAPPSGVTRDGILRLDQKMLDLWWNQLDLGDISLWRTWERSWSQDKASRQ